MKKMMFVFVAVLMSAGVMAQEKPVEASLKSAVVFLNGAELTQEAVLPLQKGENEIRIEGLSPQINRNSLKVSLSNGVVVSQFDYGVDYLSADKNNKALKPLQDSLQLYEKELKSVNNSLQLNQKMQELLLAGVDHSMQVERQNITSEAIEKNLSYYQRRSLQLAEEKMVAEQRKEVVQKRITALKQQIKQDGTASARRSGILTLSLLSPKAGNAKATIKYFTSQARWTPFYDLQVNEVGKPVDLNLKAHVSQTTGLDWKQVALTLSTGTPSRSNSLPSFGIWQLEQQVMRTYSSRNYMAAKAVATMDMRVAEDSEEVIMEESDGYSQSIEDHIQQSEQALMLEFVIDLPYNISGNGKEQTISLAKKQVTDVDYKYQTLPKLDGSVYLTAELKNWEQLSLLDGIANITFGDTYFGQTYLNTSSTDAALKVTLGDDPQLSVKREKVAQMSKTKTAGQNKVVTQTYKITVKNNKRQAVKLSLQEQYPVSAAKEIQVSLEDNTTKWTANNTERGLLTYEFELAPGESKEVVVGYSVKYPKDWKINL